ncbi:multimeric flavodoxin WrbA [Bacilli bacterium PM5-3]|nr:multimeric flavodoxin WrbA [Bacilli bacterium PM5-3]
MKIVVINGTEVKGCTYHIKEMLLTNLRKDNEIVEFYLPKDAPNFCCGCKLCFYESAAKCPHAASIGLIWTAIKESDLIIFAYPVYTLRAPGQVKSLLDHFGCHWMVHRPKKEMFNKRAIILTQSVGASNKAAQNDVATSLTWLGVSSIKKLGIRLNESIIWEEISTKRKEKIEKKVKKLAKNHKIDKRVKPNLKVKLYFQISKMLHQRSIKKTKNELSVDDKHWIKNGWINIK